MKHGKERGNWINMTGLKDTEPAAILENENWWDGYEPEETDWLLETVDCTTLNPTEAFVKLYSAEQMQEYAKAQAKKVFWYAAKGTSEDRALLARAIDYAFKEKQDEEV